MKGLLNNNAFVKFEGLTKSKAFLLGTMFLGTSLSDFSNNFYFLSEREDSLYEEASQMKRRFRNALVIIFVLLFAIVFIVSSEGTVNDDKSVKKAQPQTYIPAGDDTFETPDNGETVDDFSGSPIPAGFFGPGSLPYKGTVVLKGKPLSEYGDQNIDTVVTRESGGNVPFTTSLRMKALSMQSAAPITVSFEDGHTEKWDVAVKLSPSVASTGSMTINEDGTFDSELNVYPYFTFTRNAGLNGAYVEAIRRMDTGSLMVQMYLKSLKSKEKNNAAIVPCPVIKPIEPIEGATEKSSVAASEDQGKPLCTPPVKLKTSNSPWRTCGGRFCIPVPITEKDLLAKHFARFILVRVVTP